MRTELRQFLADRYGPEQQDRQRAAATLETAVARFYTTPPWRQWQEITKERASWNNL
jgi:hypothetical protein